MNSLSVVSGIIVAVNTSPLWEACHIRAVRSPQEASIQALKVRTFENRLK